MIDREIELIKLRLNINGIRRGVPGVKEQSSRSNLTLPLSASIRSEAPL